jgi:hypothetical protein
MTGLGAFAGGGAWLRCQLHCHTTRSDGTPEPDELVRHYADAGFDVVAITDHWLITAAEPDPDGPLLLPASELSADLPRAPFEAEVLALGIDALPEPRAAFGTLAACADWIAERGGAAVLAHPRWSMLTPDDVLAAPALHGLEVFNGGCALEQGNGLADAVWDAVSERGLLLGAVATDDAHRAGDPTGSDSLLGWTWVRAAARTPDAVVAALRAGRAYGSSGPVIHALERVAGGLEVACSPAVAMALASGPWDGGRVSADPARAAHRARVLERDADGLIVRAHLDEPEFCGWGRVEVEAPGGGRAWTGPIGLPGARAPYRPEG